MQIAALPKPPLAGDVSAKPISRNSRHNQCAFRARDAFSGPDSGMSGLFCSCLTCLCQCFVFNCFKKIYEPVCGGSFARTTEHTVGFAGKGSLLFLCQERVNICFELVALLVGWKGKAPAWEGVGLELTLTWVSDVPAGVIWHQSEDNLEVFVVTGIILCGSGSRGFAFSSQSLLPLQSWVLLRDLLQSAITGCPSINSHVQLSPSAGGVRIQIHCS